MGYRMPDRPRFLETALQGLAFWIGHRQAVFPFYPLAEAALVAEMCNLIQANLSDTLSLRPEYLYRDLVPPDRRDRFDGLTRADLVITTKLPDQPARGANLAEHVQFVMEVKRSAAGKGLIDEDLRKLHRFLEATPTQARALLIVTSESKAPDRFVEDGKSRLHSHEIPKCAGCFHVRRTVKAAASFSNKTTAHYVCLIEVFREQPQRLPAI
jgi:hypothetical protein